MFIHVDLAVLKFAIISVKIVCLKNPGQLSIALARIYYIWCAFQGSIPSQSKVNCIFHRKSMDILYTDRWNVYSVHKCIF